MVEQTKEVYVLRGFNGFFKWFTDSNSSFKKPMIRKNGELEEVSWDEAINFTASKLKEIKDKYGPDSIMGTGCARGSGNEANYIMQKFMR